MLEVEVVRNLVIRIPTQRKIVTADRHATHIEVGTDTGAKRSRRISSLSALASVFKEVLPSSLKQAPNPSMV
jgi:hypothetical protein